MSRCLFAVWLGFASFAWAGLPAIPLNEEWKTKIRNLAPEKPTVEPKAKHKVLLYSECTGYKHWVIPHANEVIKILGDKSGAYEVLHSTDIKVFEAESLKQFDAVVMNNNCSKRPRRHLFMDMLDDEEEAQQLERNLIDFVARGGGLVGMHGAIVAFNNSEEFSDTLGGSFDYHPEQQKVTLNLVEAGHPLLKAFKGEPFVHVDEPYIFKNAYAKKNFRPLLVIDTSKLSKAKGSVMKDDRYISWIKPHGKGRVFYCSVSHNAQSYESSRMLQYYLDGMQYVLGDLDCEDTPTKKQ